MRFFYVFNNWIMNYFSALFLYKKVIQFRISALLEIENNSNKNRLELESYLSAQKIMNELFSFS
jgi:hypothetical protein